MKIAVSAQQDSLSSPVDPRFGRAPFFIIYDTDTDSHEIISNAENVTAGQGAGIQAVQLVAGHNVEMVISGRVGPKAFVALGTAGIRVASWQQGTVSEAIDLARDNRLEFINQANAAAHWQQ